MHLKKGLFHTFYCHLMILNTCRVIVLKRNYFLKKKNYHNQKTGLEVKSFWLCYVSDFKFYPGFKEFIK